MTYKLPRWMQNTDMLEPVEAWYCAGCDSVSDDKIEAAYYVCGACGQEFNADDGEGSGNRCPGCGKFATKESDFSCYECGGGPVEQKDGALCDCGSTFDLDREDEIQEHIANEHGDKLVEAFIRWFGH